MQQSCRGESLLIGNLPLVRVQTVTPVSPSSPDTLNIYLANFDVIEVKNVDM